MPGFNMSRRRRVLWATDVMIWLLSFSLALNKGCCMKKGERERASVLLNLVERYTNAYVQSYYYSAS